jgi:hypothetical protein
LIALGVLFRFRERTNHEPKRPASKGAKA